MPRLTLKNRLNSTGSTEIVLEEAVSEEDAADLTARISAAGDNGLYVYIGGERVKLASVTAAQKAAPEPTAAATVKG